MKKLRGVLGRRNFRKDERTGSLDNRREMAID